MEWRVLFTEDSRTGFEHWIREAEAVHHMDFDAELLEEATKNLILPTLRLYRWQQSAITVGRFQNVERTVNAEFCQQHSIPIARRITGGRGILHGTDLTVCLAAPLSAILPDGYESKGVGQIYKVLSDVFLKTFAECGIGAVQGQECRCSTASGNCFALQSEADILNAEGTEKIVGMALHRSGDHFLMQATIPRAGDEELLASVFPGSNIRRALPMEFPLRLLEDTLVSQFADKFGFSVKKCAELLPSSQNQLTGYDECDILVDKQFSS